MNIPWKLKSRAFRLLSRLPGGALYFVQRHVTRRSRVDIRMIHEGWKYHREAVERTGAKRLIEFGAGKTLAQNLYLSDLLDLQEVVDLNPMMELGMVNEAIVQLVALGASLDGRPVRSAAELEEIYGIRYRAPFDMRATGHQDASFDICVSTNTLEHVPRDDIAAIFTELRRILRPDGRVSAMIDYSDHYAHSDRSLSRLHYLTLSETEWQRHNHANHYQNRLRHGHYADIFASTGFAVLSDEPTDYADPAGLALRDELCTGAPTDFATTGFWQLTPDDAG